MLYIVRITLIICNLLVNVVRRLPSSELSFLKCLCPTSRCPSTLIALLLLVNVYNALNIRVLNVCFASYSIKYFYNFRQSFSSCRNPQKVCLYKLTKLICLKAICYSCKQRILLLPMVIRYKKIIQKSLT